MPGTASLGKCGVEWRNTAYASQKGMFGHAVGFAKGGVGLGSAHFPGQVLVVARGIDGVVCVCVCACMPLVYIAIVAQVLFKA